MVIWLPGGISFTSATHGLNTVWGAQAAVESAFGVLATGAACLMAAGFAGLPDHA